MYIPKVQMYFCRILLCLKWLDREKKITSICPRMAVYTQFKRHRIGQTTKNFSRCLKRRSYIQLLCLFLICSYSNILSNIRFIYYEVLYWKSTWVRSNTSFCFKIQYARYLSIVFTWMLETGILPLGRRSEYLSRIHNDHVRPQWVMLIAKPIGWVH